MEENFKYHYAQQHLVSIKKFTSSITRVMDTTYRLMKGRKDHSLLPILIGLEMDYGDVVDATPLFRHFLNNLIRLRHNHFTRFVTDTLWAIEANHGYIFYTHDGPKDDIVDIIWYVKAINETQVEVSLRSIEPNFHQEVINELSYELKKFVPLVKSQQETENRMDTMIRFYRSNDKICKSTYLDNDFHIFLIPNSVETGYYPLPLLGMSYIDAKRHYRQVLRQIDYQKHAYFEIFDGSLTNKDVLHTLITLLQDNQRSSKQDNLEKESYNILEMLFGWWSTYHDGRESDHDLILFDILKETNTIDVYRYPMYDLYPYR